MKVKPLQDRILVKRFEEKETLKGGIIIPDTAKEKPQEGTVIAVGRGRVLVERHLSSRGWLAEASTRPRHQRAPQTGREGRRNPRPDSSLGRAAG